MTLETTIEGFVQTLNLIGNLIYVVVLLVVLILILFVVKMLVDIGTKVRNK